MNAGDLGVRVDDLEKANESVAVRLSKLRRGGSVKSTASSFNSDPDDFKPKRKNPAKVRNIWFLSPLIPTKQEKNVLVLLSLYIF